MTYTLRRRGSIPLYIVLSCPPDQSYSASVSAPLTAGTQNTSPNKTAQQQREKKIMREKRTWLFRPQMQDPACNWLNGTVVADPRRKEMATKKRKNTGCRLTWPTEMSEGGHRGKHAGVDQVPAVIENVHVTSQLPNLWFDVRTHASRIMRERAA